MKNITDLTESETNIGGDTFTCPKCGEPQSLFIDRGHGWVRCPSCDTGVQKRQIPEEYHHLIKKVDYKKKEEKEVEEETIVKPQKVTTATPQPSEREELFDRPKEDWEILGQVLGEFNVPDTVRNYISKRAKRSGSMDPNELARALSDLKSKLTQKEITYVTEEYYEAIMAERERRREDNTYRPYPSFGSTESGSQSFPWRKGSQGQIENHSNLPSWERDRREKSDALTPADFERMWNERVDKVESKKTISELKDTINNMGNVVMQLENQIKNPPKTDDSDRFYKIIMEKDEKSNLQLLTLMKEMQDSRDSHNKQLIELYKTQASRTSTEGYKQDNVRLVADAINAATGVVRENKPLHTAVKTLAKAQQPNQPTEPVEAVAEAEGDVGILSLVNPKYIKEK